MKKLEGGSPLPQLAVAEERLYFGSVIPESTSTKDMTIWNSGMLPVTVDSIVAPPEFTLNQATPITIDVDGRLEFQVSFTPQEDGFASGSTYVYCNAQRNLHEVMFIASAWYPHIEVSPDSLSFGYVPMEADSTLVLEARSVGATPLTIFRVETPLGFASSFEGPVTLQWPDPPIQIPIIFSPSEPQIYQGELLIISNTENDTAAIPVHGIGTARLLSIPEDTLDFGSIPIGTDSSMILLIRCNGTQEVTIDRIEVPNGFRTIFQQPMTIQPGGQLTTPLYFIPDTAAVFEGTCQVVSDAENSPSLVWLSGIGLPAESADNPISIPTDYYLSQNYPNPFNSETTIRFGIPETATIRLALYDVLGRQLEIIVQQSFSPGHYMFKWSCTDCGSGIYFLKLRAGGFFSVRKTVILR
jgi:hypothetical protein